ncbi:MULTISPECIES: hypothetical protein [Marinobacter]|jgi:predicted AlkP superfamily phosphohydrolase/phosphomutase|uniref:Uncharacterized protein n=2 Tax=Marinobacter nauticus TaxID=2743 RepID=A0A3B8WGZ3_MARNT|nr:MULTISPECIES: hypothetical protein [Marinobacter]MCG8521364.1 hypothetical protein [Pseudomonadales bacterium]ERS85982.1 hypothetical protein Q667_16755 [Marinobacter sp. C1S70]MBW3197201.1 hypothetical protein [Marinobacter nauticus]MBY5936421.1 hypothetical protein [Marinobacter nauticus]MBY5953650.1 hypothetical protein [Marinobacter nauticus]
MMMALNVPTGQPPRWQTTELVSMLLSPGARQVVRYWLSSEHFLDEQKHPKVVLATPHEPHSFVDLVQIANPNLVPSVVLAELLRKGIVETLESGHVLLKRSAYAPWGATGSLSLGNYDDFVDIDKLRRRHNDS